MIPWWFYLLLAGIGAGVFLWPEDGYDRFRDDLLDFPPDDPPDLREPVEWWNGAESNE